jgi:OCT family organic cation transporter-like MFS transporter 4/5
MSLVFNFQILVHAPVFGLMILWFVLPESPRWLIAAGRTKDAQAVLSKAAKANKKTLHYDWSKSPETSKERKPEAKGLADTFGRIQNFVDTCYDFRKEFFGKQAEAPKAAATGRSEAAAPSAEVTLFDLFRPRAMLLRTLNLGFQWFSVTFVYYGLSFGSTSLSGDPYANFCLNVFIEIPGYLFAMLVMDCWGRKPILVFSQVLPGLACICAGVLAENPSMAPLQVASECACSAKLNHKSTSIKTHQCM